MQKKRRDAIKRAGQRERARPGLTILERNYRITVQQCEGHEEMHGRPLYGGDRNKRSESYLGIQVRRRMVGGYKREAAIRKRNVKENDRRRALILVLIAWRIRNRQKL